MEVLLAEPDLVPQAAAAVRPDEIAHPGLRQLLEGLYDLWKAGQPPTLDLLRPRLDSAPLAAKALELQETGRMNPDRQAWLRQILARFQERRLQPVTQELHTQLNTVRDPAAVRELLRQLQNQFLEANGRRQPAGNVPPAG